MSCCSCHSACVQKIGFGCCVLFFGFHSLSISLCLALLVAYFYISFELHTVKRCASREDFNAFIIGCVYGFFMAFIKQSSSLAVAPMSFIIWRCAHRHTTSRTNATAQNRFIEFTGFGVFFFLALSLFSS